MSDQKAILVDGEPHNPLKFYNKGNSGHRNECICQECLHHLAANGHTVVVVGKLKPAIPAPGTKEWYESQENILHARIRELEGAMDSQDNREREAGEKCDIPYSEHGCDWPDAAADRIIFLRSENQRLRQAVEELIEAGQAMRDSDCSEDACALWADIYARASALAAKGGKS